MFSGYWCLCSIFEALCFVTVLPLGSMVSCLAYEQLMELQLLPTIAIELPRSYLQQLLLYGWFRSVNRISEIERYSNPQNKLAIHTLSGKENFHI
jgi:hypothetical protein